MVPDLRVRACSDAPVRADGRYVLYWMIGARRLGWNFALERAIELAESLQRPLLILEALQCDYPWASDRLHRFVLDGMREHAAALRDGPIRYYPYVEPAPGAGRGLLTALGRHACAVVTDDSPAFFLPGLVRAAADRLPVALEAVDSTGLAPLRAADRPYPTAYAFRRFLQRTLPGTLAEGPAADPAAGASLPRLARLPAGVRRRWPPAPAGLLAGRSAALSRLPIDHAVAPVGERPGGPGAAARVLDRFVAERLPRYAEEARHPDGAATSELSPYLHFGHISAHEVVAAVGARVGWTPGDVSSRRDGRRAGWWGMPGPAEAFLDQLVTWRELGHNTAVHLPGHGRYESLPAWARRTLEAHAGDPREHVYGLEELDAARTHDPIWNAAQRQLRADGTITNYLRMLWGKQILAWTASPREALRIMLELNNRYALDGRDPNSESGIFWTLGRYDRAWGPERPVFGTVRYMSSAQARRKLRMGQYLARWGAEAVTQTRGQAAAPRPGGAGARSGEDAWATRRRRPTTRRRRTSWPRWSRG